MNSETMIIPSPHVTFVAFGQELFIIRLIALSCNASKSELAASWEAFPFHPAGQLAHETTRIIFPQYAVILKNPLII